MEFENTLYEKEGQVAYITLNRPKKMNSFSNDLQRDLKAALSLAEDDDDVKVIVFKGAGRCFSAGAPLDEVGYVYGMKTPKPGEKTPRVPQRVKLDFDRTLFYEFFRRVLYCKKLTIAQLHGYCLGVMFTLVLHMDMIISSEDCKMGHVEERLGLGGMTISPIMILRCGLTKALDLCLTGKMIDGKRAADWNLINRAVPTMGISRGLLDHAIMHSFQTNRVYDADEHNFFKNRRDMGVKDAAHQKDDYYKALDK